MDSSRLGSDAQCMAGLHGTDCSAASDASRLSAALHNPGHAPSNPIPGSQHAATSTMPPLPARLPSWPHHVSAGPLLVKAGVWTLVEQLHASGRSKLYTGWPPTAQQVQGVGAAPERQLACASSFEVAASLRTQHLISRPPCEGTVGCEPCGSQVAPAVPTVCCSPISTPSPAHQAAYMLFTIVALDYLHDAWFYWTHRLLHWKPLYRHVHAVHHE